MTSDNDRAEWAADEAEAQPTRADPEAPDADTQDQQREVAPGERRGRVSRAVDAPEADAIEQAAEVPLEPEDEPEGQDDEPTAT